MIRCCAFLLVLVSFLLKAQDKDKEFFDEFGNPTSDESQSLYYKVGKKSTFKRTSGTKTYTVESYNGTVYTYFTKDNKLRSKVTYEEGYLNGPYLAYHENGTLKQSGQYSNNQKNGSFTSWYPDNKKHMKVEYTGEEKAVVNDVADVSFKIIDYWDSLGNTVIAGGSGTCACYFMKEQYTAVREAGKVIDGYREGDWRGFRGDTLAFEETYTDGKFVKGTRYYPEEYTYDKLETQAEYTGGLEAMNKFILQNLVYPKGARRRGEEGDVHVQFIVEKDGSLSGVEIVKGVSDEIDKEAVRVMKSMPPWKPARLRGRLVKNKFVLPLKFGLE